MKTVRMSLKTLRFISGCLMVFGLPVLDGGSMAYGNSITRPTIQGCNSIIDEGTWCGNALPERILAANTTTDTFLPSTSDASSFLNEIKEIAQLNVTAFINVTNRAGGSYNDWYSQFSIEGYNDVNQWLATVSNPPQWTEDSVLAYRSLPANYWEYTPARSVETTMSGFTNEFTRSGFGTADYGWAGLHHIILAMEELYFNTGYVKQDMSGSDVEECTSSVPSCGIPPVYAVGSMAPATSGNISNRTFHAFYGEREGALGRGGNSVESSRFKYGICDNQPVFTQIVTRTQGLFQWYDFVGIHMSARLLSNIDRPADPCAPPYWTEEYSTMESNRVVSGYSLVVSANADAIHDNGFVGISPGAVYIASDAWIQVTPEMIPCATGWFDTGGPCEFDGTLAVLCGEQHHGDTIHISFSSSTSTWLGLAVGIVRPQFEYE